MTHYIRNVGCSFFLAIADFISFVLSLYISLQLLSFSYLYVPTEQIEGWISLHWVLGVLCVGWYGIRLRHYFYRKTFWFELKEIIRTLLIFAVIEMAIMAFAKWDFYRYAFFLTWLIAILLVPIFRIVTKWFLNKIGLWARNAWIIGSGKNAIDAFKAIQSEHNLGLNIIGYVDECDIENDYFKSLHLKHYKFDSFPIDSIPKTTQFIVAVESEQSEIRNSWLRTFMMKGFRYVSIIPTLRGVPLDSTDMSFIFSHDVMIFRVHNNLAKISSRVLKRIFDIVGASIIIIILSPLLIYISLKVKKGEDQRYMAIKELVKEESLSIV